MSPVLLYPAVRMAEEDDTELSASHETSISQQEMQAAANSPEMQISTDNGV